MNKALNAIAVIVFLLAVVSLALGYMLWDKREELKGRADQLARAVARAAQVQGIDNVRGDLDEIDYAELETQINNFTAGIQSVKARLDETTAALKSTREELDITRGTLEKEREKLAQANLRIDEQNKKIASLQKEIEDRDLEIAAIRDENTDLTIKASEVEGLRSQVKALQQENRLLTEDRDRLQKLVERAGGQGDTTAESSPGVVGRVLAVNPRFEYVVVSLGRRDNLMPTAPLLVYRDDKLIAKLKATNRIEEDMAVANVEPGWVLGDIREGDHVLY